MTATDLYQPSYPQKTNQANTKQNKPPKSISNRENLGSAKSPSPGKNAPIGRPVLNGQPGKHTGAASCGLDRLFIGMHMCMCVTTVKKGQEFEVEQGGGGVYSRIRKEGSGKYCNYNLKT